MRAMMSILLAAAMLPGRDALADSQPPAAGNTPTEIMRPMPQTVVPPGYVLSFLYTIELAAPGKEQLLPCKALFARDGFLQQENVVTGTDLPAPRHLLSGSKTYREADPAADTLLQAVNNARCGDSVTWTVAHKIHPASR